MAAAIARAPAAEPMMEINTTPLIDVMLVLLIMLIMTVPSQNHSVPLDLPGPGPVLKVQPIVNRLGVTAGGALLWNGHPAPDASIAQALRTVASEAPASTSELQLVPDPAARFERVDAVLAMTKRAGVVRMGFVGNERYGRF